ncbi:DinB family protein [Streptomyces sp. DH10]|uniref:DinB family protein n=1 Tax=Streptomyces sp. DH10 TaxID=3040121 RepID=UPI0024427A5A|nr:DinB family protein [Streptomyces sp. DH10]MDG9711365.1 DinB family protein [Streptomyces sp. DH10]
MGEHAAMDRQAVGDDYARARRTFHALLDTASQGGFDRSSDGMRWTNRQLLWHMLFGYVLTRVLLVMARAFSRLPRRLIREFARLLDAGTKPFDLVNYLGPCGAARVVGPQRMGAMFDRVTGALERRFAADSEVALARGMHYPVRWDPFFKDFMTLADIYRYPTQHFDFHHRQLTLDAPG